MNRGLWVAAAAVWFAAVCGAAHAQGVGDAGSAGRGGHGGQRGGGGHARRAAPATTDLPKLKPDPWPRLDAGALLCPSEDSLQQHQAAVSARLDGRSLPEPRGCRIVARMTPVAIMARHEPGRTEVRLPGPPEEVGWTDTAMRGGP